MVTLQTLRFNNSAATLFDWELEQVDFDTAFLNGKLDREVFLEPPPGYDDDPMHLVHLLLVCSAGTSGRRLTGSRPVF